MIESADIGLLSILNDFHVQSVTCSKQRNSWDAGATTDFNWIYVYVQSWPSADIHTRSFPDENVVSQMIQELRRPLLTSQLCFIEISTLSFCVICISQVIQIILCSTEKKENLRQVIVYIQCAGSNMRNA